MTFGLSPWHESRKGTSLTVGPLSHVRRPWSSPSPPVVEPVETPPPPAVEPVETPRPVVEPVETPPPPVVEPVETRLLDLEHSNDIQSNIS